MLREDFIFELFDGEYFALSRVLSYFGILNDKYFIEKNLSNYLKKVKFRRSNTGEMIVISLAGFKEFCRIKPTVNRSAQKIDYQKMYNKILSEYEKQSNKTQKKEAVGEVFEIFDNHFFVLSRLLKENRLSGFFYYIKNNYSEYIKTTLNHAGQETAIIHIDGLAKFATDIHFSEKSFMKLYLKAKKKHDMYHKTGSCSHLKEDTSQTVEDNKKQEGLMKNMIEITNIPQTLIHIDEINLANLNNRIIVGRALSGFYLLSEIREDLTVVIRLHALKENVREEHNREYESLKLAIGAFLDNGDKIYRFNNFDDFSEFVKHIKETYYSK